jgi:hypothetical protein
MAETHIRGSALYVDVPDDVEHVVVRARGRLVMLSPPARRPPFDEMRMDVTRPGAHEVDTRAPGGLSAG